VEKASRSTLVDVRSDAQIGITVVLANADLGLFMVSRCMSLSINLINKLYRCG
jgi:hypothetical protein